MDAQKQLKILSLEDCEEDAELMALELRRGGILFSLKRVWTREAFLREIEDFSPEIIISDYTLPTYDGLSALTEARQRCPDVPFVFLSGTMGEDFAIETLTQGATDYVLKSRLSRLVPAVNRSLQVAEERRERSKAELALRDSEEKFKGLAASAQDAIIMIDQEGKVAFWNNAAERVFGYSSREILGREMHLLLAPAAYRDHYQKGFLNFSRTGEGPFIGKLMEVTALRKDGAEFPVELSMSALHFKGAWHAISVLRDITERKRTEETARRQLENMTALRDIEIAVSSSLDLRVTLNVLLEKLITRLGVDAADVLLLDQNTLYLGYAAGRGFRNPLAQNAHVRMGKGHAGQAAYERRAVIIPNVSEILTPSLKGEGFEAYIAMPLITQGKVKGVLETFHRKKFNPDPEWLSFLELISGQAAIAIDNAAMYDSLQRSNAEIILAYDATLEGWGRTLELRDADTNGHTERVADKTVVLARAMGVADHDLVNVRRGALLHDIGKMCIPDAILRKNGPLSQEENEILRRHPDYAFDLLSAIPFLRPTIDIPYCHHEKWDGSGYPRGLKGQAIPFHARIFTVIDVADALIYDRPYRPAWPVDKTYDYIKSLSGIHFDPEVVDVFLKLPWE